MAYDKSEAAAEHDFAHAVMAGAGLILLALILALLVTNARAATLGRLSVASTVGQPLAAAIEVDASRHELDAIGVRLASAGAYRSAGMPYSSALRSLTFRLAPRPGGRHVVEVASRRPMNEPVIYLLVDLAWREGSRSYGYTALIDPPGNVGHAAAPPAFVSSESADGMAVVPRKAAKRVARIDEAERRVAEQVRLKEERAIADKQRLADAKERIADLENTVRQQQQLLDMETASKLAGEGARATAAQPAAGATPTAQASERHPRHALPSVRAATDSPFGPTAYLGAAVAALLLVVFLIVRRRRASDDGCLPVAPTFRAAV